MANAPGRGNCVEQQKQPLNRGSSGPGGGGVGGRPGVELRQSRAAILYSNKMKLHCFQLANNLNRILTFYYYFISMHTMAAWTQDHKICRCCAGVCMCVCVHECDCVSKG